LDFGPKKDKSPNGTKDFGEKENRVFQEETTI
jgi:hypothetical protein